jgi:hypothetical protein
MLLSGFFLNGISIERPLLVGMKGKATFGTLEKSIFRSLYVEHQAKNNKSAHHAGSAG